MNGKWQTATLAEVCDVISRGISPSYDEDGDTIVLNQRCVRNHTIDFGPSRRHNSDAKKVPAVRLIKPGDVLVNSTGVGTLGRVSQVRDVPTEPVTVDSHITILRPRANFFVDEFFGYMLVGIEGDVSLLGQGSGGQIELSKASLGAMQVSWPNAHTEQQRIVRLLDEAFEGITVAKANAEKNLQNARALFKSQLQSVFTQSGNGWTDRALEEICSVSAGNSAPQDPGYFTEGTIPFFRTSDAGRIKFGTIYESQDKLNSHGASKLRRYPAGTILFPKSGASTFLNHRVVLGVEGCVSSHLATIVPDLDHVLPQFLLYALTLIDAKDLIQDQSYPSLNLPAIENIRIYLPPLDEQQQVVHLLDELQVITDKLARICSAKQASLEDLKESLLHQAFSGNLEAA
jgi:type I restriction enzyme S subunit